MNIPPPRSLPGRVPNILVGDETLKPHIMKTCPARSLTEDQRVFNNRLGTGTASLKTNCFGILVNRLAILGHEMKLCPGAAITVT